jgi:hypothetical protein
VVSICARQPFTAMDYICEDVSFHEVAVGCLEVYREHGRPQRKSIAFEGPNTGRRFYMCSIENVSSMFFEIYSNLAADKDSNEYCHDYK